MYIFGVNLAYKSYVSAVVYDDGNEVKWSAGNKIFCVFDGMVQ